MPTTTPIIPGSEGNFTAYAHQFVTQISDNPKQYQLPNTLISNLGSQLTEWDDAYAAAIAARDAAKAATRLKDAVRKSLEETIREATRRVQANSDVTNEARAAAGIKIHKSGKTPVGRPTTAPTGNVISTERLEHTLMFSDSTTPTRRAKPAGVKSCEVMVYIGENASRDPKQYRLATITTRTPVVISFEPEDGGKTANYLLRWLNSTDEPGPWSQIINATIPAV